MSRLVVLILALMVGGAAATPSVSMKTTAGISSQNLLCEEPTRLGGG